MDSSVLTISLHLETEPAGLIEGMIVETLTAWAQWSVCSGSVRLNHQCEHLEKWILGEHSQLSLWNLEMLLATNMHACLHPLWPLWTLDFPILFWDPVTNHVLWWFKGHLQSEARAEADHQVPWFPSCGTRGAEFSYHKIGGSTDFDNQHPTISNILIFSWYWVWLPTSAADARHSVTKRCLWRASRVRNSEIHRSWCQCNPMPQSSLFWKRHFLEFVVRFIFGFTILTDSMLITVMISGEQRSKPPYWFYTKRKLAYFRESKNLTRESCAKALAKEGFKVLTAKAPRKLEMIILC